MVPAMALMALALALAPTACSPIETWRSMSGIAKNDPDPATAPFTKNLATAEAEPYPNLASVPPPPTRETSTAERQKLTQSLLADRAQTQALGGAVASAAASAAPSAHAANPSRATSGGTAPGGTAPGGAGPAGAGPGGAGPVGAAPVASVALLGAPAMTNIAAAPGTGKAVDSSGRRRADEPPVPQPLESSLQTPQIPSVPEPEATRPAPPPPVLPALARPAPAATELPPAAVASAMPEPAPPAPVLAPIAPPPAPPKEALGKPAKPAPTTITVATLDLSGTPAEGERAEIARVSALYKAQPRGVMVTAYAAAPAAGSDPLAAYRAALDRAQAVAKELAAAGIPAGRIQTQAAPVSGATAAGRVDIQLTQ